MGKFAEENNLTIDSIRYYMELDLLLPDKKGSQYYFDEQCSEDVKDIIELKKYGFKLIEIRDILYIKRLAYPITYKKNNYYKENYINKHKEVSKQIAELRNVKNRLSNKIDEISAAKLPHRENMGIDVNALSLLGCPICNRNLVLKECDINGTKILSGILKCKCGKSYLIEDGIIVSNKSEHMENPFGNDIEKFFLDYSKKSNLGFINILTKNLRWLSKRFSKEINEDTIILELGVGYGVFLRNVYENLLDNNIYIAVDHNISVLKSLREMLKTIDPNKIVILICSDVLDIPLKQDTVDFIIDIGGHATNNSFLLKYIDKYAKVNSVIFGSYIISNNLLKNDLIQGIDTNNFILENVKTNFKNIKYDIIEEKTSKEISDIGEYELELDENCKISNYICFLKR
nr:MerR family transcriptional regulator [Clostridium sp. 'deep sea']